MATRMNNKFNSNMSRVLHKLGRNVRLGLSILLFFVFLFPYYYIMLQSVTPWSFIDKTIIPKGFTIDSYLYLLTNGGSANKLMWIRALANSLIVSLTATTIFCTYGFTDSPMPSQSSNLGDILSFIISFFFKCFSPVLFCLFPNTCYYDLW